MSYNQASSLGIRIVADCGSRKVHFTTNFIKDTDSWILAQFIVMGFQ